MNTESQFPHLLAAERVSARLRLSIHSLTKGVGTHWDGREKGGLVTGCGSYAKLQTLMLQVVTNPPPEERLDPGDRVFVLRERGGPWLTALPPASNK